MHRVLDGVVEAAMLMSDAAEMLGVSSCIHVLTPWNVVIPLNSFTVRFLPVPQNAVIPPNSFTM